MTLDDISRFMAPLARRVMLTIGRGRLSVVEFETHNCEMDCEQPVTDEAWAHAFQVWGLGRVVTEATCEDDCERPLRAWSALPHECAVRRLAPAHTVPLFGSFTDEWDFLGGLPAGATFARAAPANRRNHHGQIETMAANVPRLNYQTGLTYNETSNPWGDGAIGGALAGFQVMGGGGGWTLTKIGAGMLDGVPYVDIEAVSTTATNTNNIYLTTRDASKPIATTLGETLSAHAGAALIEAEGFTLSAITLRFYEMNGAFRTGSFSLMAAMPGLGALVEGGATRTFSNASANNAAVVLDMGDPIIGVAPRFVARVLFPVVHRGAPPLTASVPVSVLAARRNGVPQYGLLGLLLEAGEELRLAVPDGAYTAQIEAAHPDGTVATWPAAGLVSANGSLRFDWPAAATLAGFNHIRRIILRKVT